MTTSPSRDPWFLALAANPRAPFRLFCVPYAGVGASCYVPWARLVRTAPVEMLAVQLPGRENRLREPPLRRVDAVVDQLVVAIEARLDRPYAIFGHSMGALLTYELVRRLRDRGSRLPVHVFMSGAQPPQVPRDEDPIHRLPDREFVLSMQTKYQGFSQDVLDNRELLELVVPALRADIELIETHEFVPVEPLPCPMSAWVGDQDTVVKETERWSELTSGPFEHRRFSGDHFYLTSARAELLAAMASRLGLSF